MVFHQNTEWFSILLRWIDLSKWYCVLKNRFSYSLSRVCIDRIKYKAHRTAHECPGAPSKSENLLIIACRDPGSDIGVCHWDGLGFHGF